VHYLFENRLRRLFQRPERILAPYIGPGSRCLDVGCGLGFFTLPMARMVRPAGEVVAVDVDERLLEELSGSAEAEGLNTAIRTVLTPIEELSSAGPFDFVNCMWSMHETDDPAEAARRIADRLAPGGRILVAEPRWHVSAGDFEDTVRRFVDAGLLRHGEPPVGLSRAALLARPSTCAAGPSRPE
jgi:2-polyprenyl-3-methyl-5-hydroxy-6-metoxy-1,4-benzoquinol methylase